MVGKTYSEGNNVGIITRCENLSGETYSHLIMVHMQGGVHTKDSKIMRIVRRNPEHNDFKIL